MLTLDAKLTKVSDNRRRATIYLRSDLKDHQMAREELSSMGAATKAVAEAVDLKIPDPRINAGPSVVPLQANGELMTDTETQKLGGYVSIFEVDARLI
jgi:hypothetical protein